MKFILASQNKHKVQEFAESIASIRIQPSPISIDVEENGSSFLENAAIKARAYANALKLNAIADDSGLSVDALHGAPGIYSARYAALPPNADLDPDRDSANIRKLLCALAQTPKESRTAHFTCALCLVIVEKNDLQTLLDTPKLRREAVFYAANSAADDAPVPDAPTLTAENIARAEIAFEAYAYGTILTQRHGTGGFGYDPIFLSDETQTTFADLTCAQKLAVSHRGKAILRLRDLFDA